MAEAARQLSLFLLLFVVGDIFCVEVVPVRTGGNYTFKSSVSGTPQTILWKFNKNKAVEHENNELTWYRFEGRADLDIKTGDFTLKQLRKEDSGHYESEIQVAGKLQYSNHEIKVIDALPQPEVTCEVNSTGKSLLCSVGSVKAEFTWNVPNDNSKTGERISIGSEQSLKSVYICIAKNEVDEKSTEFSLQECNTGGPGESLVAIIIAVILSVVIVCVVVGLYFGKKRGICGRGSKGNDLEKQHNETHQEGIPLTSNSTEVLGSQEKIDTVHQKQDLAGDLAEGPSEELSDTKEAKEKNQQDHDMDGKAHTSSPFNGEVPTLAAPTYQENTQSEDKDGPSSSMADETEDAEKTSDGGSPFNGEVPTLAAPTYQENTQSEDKDGPSSSMADETEDAEKTSDGGASYHSEEGQENAGQNQSPSAVPNSAEGRQTQDKDAQSSSMPDKGENVEEGNDGGDAENQATSLLLLIANSVTNETTPGRVQKEIEKIENQAWKPKEIYSRSANQKGNGDIKLIK
ncbi:uncharacterized protein LOC118802132 isoform X2 [Colossoma macropomum]|uniref:uncharacterized protein LOC118802132 isoform X2 n=1 Tax=Colossoma macropomum TaxID=42526 RepID=UPI0018648AB9|nr:uncharacterized protein LOC118802132 isoform X2 [Colossoma macropomum]